MEKTKIDYIGILLVSLFFIFLTYAGYLAYISIDWDVLVRLEQQPITIPPINNQTPVTTPSPVQKP